MRTHPAEKSLSKTPNPSQLEGSWSWGLISWCSLAIFCLAGINRYHDLLLLFTRCSDSCLTLFTRRRISWSDLVPACCFTQLLWKKKWKKRSNNWTGSRTAAPWHRIFVRPLKSTAAQELLLKNRAFFFQMFFGICSRAGQRNDKTFLFKLHTVQSCIKIKLSSKKS